MKAGRSPYVKAHGRIDRKLVDICAIWIDGLGLQLEPEDTAIAVRRVMRVKDKYSKDAAYGAAYMNALESFSSLVNPPDETQGENE